MRVLQPCYVRETDMQAITASLLICLTSRAREEATDSSDPFRIADRIGTMLWSVGTSAVVTREASCSSSESTETVNWAPCTWLWRLLNIRCQFLCSIPILRFSLCWADLFCSAIEAKHVPYPCQCSSWRQMNDGHLCRNNLYCCVPSLSSPVKPMSSTYTIQNLWPAVEWR